MSVPLIALQRLQQRAAQADQLIAQLGTQLMTLKKNTATKLCREEEAKLQSENASLKQEIIILKEKLTNVEIRNGVKQFSLPNAEAGRRGFSSVVTTPPVPLADPKSAEEKQPQKQQQQQPKKEKNQKKGEPKEKAPEAPAPPVDVSRLDMRIGHIVSAKKHPDADGLYVEEVNLGEERNRTIVSGLVKHIPLEQMQDRFAIFMVNLKPAKMRGIMSEGMIMCANTPEKVEIINPPEDVVAGDKITIDGYSGTPDAMLNPKKKIWEQIQPDLLINTDGAATYKGSLWRVSDKGVCTVPTMRNSGIK